MEQLRTQSDSEEGEFKPETEPAPTAKKPRGLLHVIRVVVVSFILGTGLIVGGVGTLMVLFSLKKDVDASGVARARTAVRVLKAEPIDYQEKITSYGMARARQSTYVPAEIAGVVEKRSEKLESGNWVTGKDIDSDGLLSGDPLVWIDQRDFEQALLSAESRLKQADASLSQARTSLEGTQERLGNARENYATAETEFKRIERLNKSGNAAASELNRERIRWLAQQRIVLDLEQQEKTAHSSIQQASAEVQTATAAQSRARLNLDRTVVYAPYTGRIVSREAQVGSSVSPGTTLFQIVDLSHIEVSVELPASHYGSVSTGSIAHLKLREKSGVVWKGPIARVSPNVDSNDRTFEVYIEIQNEDGNILVPPGAFLLADIDGFRHRDVIPVPRTAFVDDHLFVVTGIDPETSEAVVEMRMPRVRKLLPEYALIEPGSSSDDGMLGIEIGDSIVITNVEQIADKTRVRIVRESNESVSTKAPEQDDSARAQSEPGVGS